MAGSKRFDEVLGEGDSALEADMPDVAPPGTPARTPSPAAPRGRHGWRLRRRGRSLADALFVAPPAPSASRPVRFDERVLTAGEIAARRTSASPLA